MQPPFHRMQGAMQEVRGQGFDINFFYETQCEQPRLVSIAMVASRVARLDFCV